MRSRAVATSSCSPPSSAWTCRAPTARTTASAGRAATSGARSRPACAGCRPTTSTSTSCTQPDPVTPIEETLGALTELVHEGKVRYLGCSNFDGWQVADAAWTSRTLGLERFVSVQNRYSLLDRERRGRGGPGRASSFGLGMLPFFPLEYGLLTGKYRRGEAAPTGSRADLDAESRRLAGECRLGPDRGAGGVRRRARPLHPRRRHRRTRRAAHRASVISGVSRPASRCAPTQPRSPLGADRRGDLDVLLDEI